MDSPINRRFFLASTTQAAAAAAIMPNMIDVRDHNAVGDGKTDDTAAIQKALDKAAETKADRAYSRGRVLLLDAEDSAQRGLGGQSDLGLRHQRRIGLAAVRRLGRVPVGHHRRLRRSHHRTVPGRRPAWATASTAST